MTEAMVSKIEITPICKPGRTEDTDIFIGSQGFCFRYNRDSQFLGDKLGDRVFAVGKMSNLMSQAILLKQARDLAVHGIIGKIGDKGNLLDILWGGKVQTCIGSGGWKDQDKRLIDYRNLDKIRIRCDPGTDAQINAPFVST